MTVKNSETQTLTKADIIDHLVGKFGFTRQQGRLLVDSFFDEIYDNLVEGRDVKLSGFGNFILKDKKSRPGRNPTTGEEDQTWPGAYSLPARTLPEPATE